METPPLELSTNMWLSEEANYQGQPIGEGDFGSYGHYSTLFSKKSNPQCPIVAVF